MLASVVVLLALQLAVANAKVSTFVGSTVTAQFPPLNPSDVASDFLDASEVGFPGATPTGDEAEAIQTAPAVATVGEQFPLLQENTADNKGASFNVLRSWGNLSPFFSVPNTQLPHTSAQIPAGFTVKQVHLLHRHGARYPTGGSAPAAFAGTLHQLAASKAGLSVSGPLSFLNTWEFHLGAEILTPFGRKQMFDLGVGFRVKYGDLVKGFKNLPVFRTTSENRMVESALHFAAGFFGVPDYQTAYNQLIMIEADTFNNTLAPYDNCPNSNLPVGNFGGPQSNAWAAIYTKSAAKRLQPFIKGLTLNSTHIIAMQELCAYETVALGFSSFCGLFTEQDFKDLEYFFDLSFWYSNGPGNPTVAAQGIGWVQELVSRLTGKLITDFNTSVNETYVNNTIFFPTDQPMFVDATHDTIISAIITAMNFTSFAAQGPLPTTHIPANNQYIISHISPFGSNLVGQVLAQGNSATPTHIRWVLNDAVVPLNGIKGCGSNKDGLCELKTFIAGMQQRLVEVDYQFGCFANISIPTPDNLVTGQL